MRADEIHVVADENERAFVLLQSAPISASMLADVEVRRRLVHEQQVRRIEQQLHEREPAFFAAAQHADGLEDVVPAEQERAEHGAGGLFARQDWACRALPAARCASAFSISTRCCAK